MVEVYLLDNDNFINPNPALRYLLNCILFDAFDESVDDRCQSSRIEAVLRGIIQVGLFPVLPVKCHRMPVRISYGRGLFAVDDGLLSSFE